MSDEADDYSDLPDEGMEDTTDIDRYDTAFGWEPPDQYKKLRDDYVKKHPLEFFHGTIFAREDVNKVFHPETPVVEQKRLFGDLVRTGELTVLFSDTGLGKSILAVQIGDAVARGVDAIPCAGTRASLPASPQGEIPLKNEAKPQRVLYIDFEMTRSQFAERYSCGIKNGKYVRPYKFRKMERLFVNWEDPLPDGFKNGTEFITHSIWKELRDTEPGLLIVDNISYLVSSPASAREASRLMKQLNAMKREFGLSILVLAHTPKRSLAKYLSINDMAGRKELGNFIDNSFAIGRSHRDDTLRYQADETAQPARDLWRGECHCLPHRKAQKFSALRVYRVRPRTPAPPSPLRPSRRHRHRPRKPHRRSPPPQRPRPHPTPDRDQIRNQPYNR